MMRRITLTGNSLARMLSDRETKSVATIGIATVFLLLWFLLAHLSSDSDHSELIVWGFYNSVAITVSLLAFTLWFATEGYVPSPSNTDDIIHCHRLNALFHVCYIGFIVLTGLVIWHQAKWPMIVFAVGVVGYETFLRWKYDPRVCCRGAHPERLYIQHSALHKAAMLYITFIAVFLFYGVMHLLAIGALALIRQVLGKNLFRGKGGIFSLSEPN